MNKVHHWLCQSKGWKKHVQDNLLPWALEEVVLGSDVLEIGPGFGVTTNLIRGRVKHLTCVEIDQALAEALRKRLSGNNVSIHCEDATRLSMRDASFDTVVCFTMLHHVPSSERQD